MILYYAIGGGLGHVRRACRVLDALQLDALIVGSIEAPGVLRIPASLESSIDEHRAWIRSLGASRIIADSFPLGIRGELFGIDVPLDYVARLLKWDEYRRVVPYELPRFGTAFLVEETAVRVSCDRVVAVSLSVTESGGSAAALHKWLVVHSGPADEVRELIAYAESLQAMRGIRAPLLVATRCAIDGVERTDADPVTLYAQAERIVSAAGFNVMLETGRWREKHDVLPFPRRFDDQFARAARRRRAQRDVVETIAAQ